MLLLLQALALLLAMLLLLLLPRSIPSFASLVLNAVSSSASY
jgi:hypothetical protein